VVPVDADLARRALALYQRFGRGLDKGFGKGLGHAAQLNFGDCFAAALSEREQLPLASAGEEFAAARF
jgi:ribonuclease VapC